MRTREISDDGTTSTLVYPWRPIPNNIRHSSPDSASLKWLLVSAFRQCSAEAALEYPWVVNSFFASDPSGVSDPSSPSDAPHAYEDSDSSDPPDSLNSYRLLLTSSQMTTADPAHQINQLRRSPIWKRISSMKAPLDAVLCCSYRESHLGTILLGVCHKHGHATRGRAYFGQANGQLLLQT
jgi:hypothetical protein